jgi:hypothetical protein
MLSPRPAPAARRRSLATGLAVLVLLVTAVVAVLVVHHSAGSAGGSAFSVLRHVHHSDRGGIGVEDGVLPDGVTVFDDHYPAVTRLDPDLLDALRRAGRDAASSGITLYVNSGWRSAQYQQDLLDEAVGKYGSEAAAERWVSTPETSLHVAGEAVDIGRPDAADWLTEHGAAYGLCRVYVNEPWHFELRADATTAGCPAMYADPTQDPRMQQ